MSWTTNRRYIEIEKLAEKSEFLAQELKKCRPTEIYLNPVQDDAQLTLSFDLNSPIAPPLHNSNYQYLNVQHHS